MEKEEQIYRKGGKSIRRKMERGGYKSEKDTPLFFKRTICRRGSDAFSKLQATPVSMTLLLRWVRPKGGRFQGDRFQGHGPWRLEVDALSPDHRLDRKYFQGPELN